MNTNLGKKLKEYRQNKFPDLALRRVADAIGVDYSYIYRVEEGVHIPSDEVLSKLTTGYDLSLEEKLEIFALAHSPEYAQVLSEMIKGGHTVRAGKVFFRRSKNKEK